MKKLLIKILTKILEWLTGGNKMHSKWFAKVKLWYDKGLWSLDMVFAAVPKMITPEEYYQITGQEYDWEEQY